MSLFCLKFNSENQLIAFTQREAENVLHFLFNKWLWVISNVPSAQTMVVSNTLASHFVLSFTIKDQSRSPVQSLAFRRNIHVSAHTLNKNKHTHTQASTPPTVLSGWLLTPEDDLSAADSLFVLGESLNSGCSRHVCGSRCDGALRAPRSDTQKIYKKAGGPLFYLFLTSPYFFLFICWVSFLSFLRFSLTATPSSSSSSSSLSESLSAAVQLCCRV